MTDSDHDALVRLTEQVSSLQHMIMEEFARSRREQSDRDHVMRDRLGTIDIRVATLEQRVQSLREEAEKATAARDAIKESALAQAELAEHNYAMSARKWAVVAAMIAAILSYFVPIFLKWFMSLA